MACSNLSKCFVLLLDLTIFLLVSVVLFVPYVLLSLYKACLVPYAKLLYGIQLLPFEGLHGGAYDYCVVLPDKAHFVSNLDLAAKPNAKLRWNIGGLFKYEGSTFEIDKFRREFYTKFLQEALEGRSRKYLNLVVHYFSFGGHIFRKRVDSIHINSHVYEVNLGERGKSVEEFSAQWLREPYQPGTPLWELVSITNDDAEATESYFALKIHHGLADGVSIAHMLEVLVGQETLQPLAETTPLIRRVLFLMQWPRIFFRHMKNIAAVAKLKVLNWSDPDDFSQHMVFGTLSMDKLKAVRKRFGVRFIPILQSLLAGAMKRLHSERGLTIPEYLNSMSSLPWANHPFHEKICNWGTTVSHRLPLSISNSEGRLLALDKEFFDTLRDGIHQTLGPAVLNLMKLLPFLDYWDRCDSLYEHVWSAMVMKGGYMLWGRKIYNIFPLACMNSRGIYAIVMSVSHATQMDFLITGSGQIFSQQQLNVFKCYIDEELENLCGKHTKGDDHIVDIICNYIDTY